MCASVLVGKSAHAKMDDCTKNSVKVDDLLTDQQLQHIVARCVGNGQLVDCKLLPAGEGLGFIGALARLGLEVQVNDKFTTLQLFVKSLPRDNQAKIKFIKENGFFEREMTVFKLIDEMETGLNSCVTKPLLYSESVLVMPDLAGQGYSIRNQLETFELPHILVTLASVARFHAAFANLETRKSLALKRHYSLLEDYGKVIVESTFQDTPWIRTAARLTGNIIQLLSKYKNIPKLEDKVLKQFLAGVTDLVVSKDSLNVVLHKDLWVNNIMFKYKDNAPINAILVDFQCVRYGPPAFDVMMLLYLTTSRSFRREHEANILQHYFKIFMETLDIDTKHRLIGSGYNAEEFLRWVTIARRFGMVATLSIFPFVLMNPEASKVFDDEQSYDQLMFEDRTAAVLAHVKICPEYGRRQVEVAEEFVERCIRF